MNEEREKVREKKREKGREREKERERKEEKERGSITCHTCEQRESGDLPTQRT